MSGVQNTEVLPCFGESVESLCFQPWVIVTSVSLLAEHFDPTTRHLSNPQSDSGQTLSSADDRVESIWQDSSESDYLHFLI